MGTLWLGEPKSWSSLGWARKITFLPDFSLLGFFCAQHPQ